MQILPINTYQNNNTPNTSFGNISQIRTNVAPYEYANTTFFMRDRLRNVIHYIVNFYKDAPLVNMICHACSEGQQAFSIKFLLMSMLKERANKYIVEGRDFDALNILSAKKGAYVVSVPEMEKMERECGFDIYKYITPCGESDNALFIKVRDYIREQVPFKKVDILKDNDIPADNTVLFASNMWPYLPAKMQDRLAEKLANTLSPSSHIVLGSFDITNHTHKLLEKAGFIQTEFIEVMKLPDVKNTKAEDARTVLNKINIYRNN